MFKRRLTSFFLLMAMSLTNVACASRPPVNPQFGFNSAAGDAQKPDNAKREDEQLPVCGQGWAITAGAFPFSLSCRYRP